MLGRVTVNSPGVIVFALHHLVDFFVIDFDRVFSTSSFFNNVDTVSAKDYLKRLLSKTQLILPAMVSTSGQTAYNFAQK